MTKDRIDFSLSYEEKHALLSMARNALEEFLGDKKAKSEQFDADIFSERRGAFVTLHKKGELRGCIGYVLAYKPLRQAVREMAIAASHDPRFDPVEANELNDIDIEISVLSPLSEIRDMSEIEIGRHGIYIKNGARSGLLLPQVATHYNWDKEMFLRQTCRKAGLAQKAWQEKETVIKIFSAQVFGEKEEAPVN